MGGFSLSDLQSWSENGRKKGLGEKLQDILQAVAEGQQQNKAVQQQDTAFNVGLAEKGYTPAQDSGMAGFLSKLAGGQPDYQYTGVPQSAKDAAMTEYYRAKAANVGNQQPKMRVPTSQKNYDMVANLIGQQYLRPETKGQTVTGSAMNAGGGGPMGYAGEVVSRLMKPKQVVDNTGYDQALQQFDSNILGQYGIQPPTPAMAEPEYQMLGAEDQALVQQLKQQGTSDEQIKKWLREAGKL